MAGAIVLMLIFIAIFAPLIAPHSPIEQYRDNVKIPPAWLDGGNWHFVLGTDEAGRDILSRLMYGARLSFWIGFVSVVLALIPGIVLGLMRRVLPEMARYADHAHHGRAARAAFAAAGGRGGRDHRTGAGEYHARHRDRRVAGLCASDACRPRSANCRSEYVTASRVAGAGTVRLMFSQVLPNCAAPLIVQATLGFSSAILDAAALGFLGLGVQPPAAEWGAMLASARDYIESAWWIVTMPGLSILISVLAINLLGDGLRDALDPKLNGRMEQLHAIHSLPPRAVNTFRAAVTH